MNTSTTPIDERVRLVPSATGSGEHLLTVGRVPSIDGHSPVVIGHYSDGVPANGRPTNWVDALPTIEDAERSAVKVGRNKRGTTRKVMRHGVKRENVDLGGYLDRDSRVRMTEAQLARMATHWARLTCDQCQFIRNACEPCEGTGEIDGEDCPTCAKGCGCMPDLMGGSTKAWSEVVYGGLRTDTSYVRTAARLAQMSPDERAVAESAIHAERMELSATCDVARHTSDLPDALSGTSIDHERFSATHEREHDESSLTWNARMNLRSPRWRKHEQATSEDVEIETDDALYLTRTELPAPHVWTNLADAWVVTPQGEITRETVARYWHGHKLVTRSINARQAQAMRRTSAQEQHKAELAKVNDEAPEVGTTTMLVLNGSRVFISRRSLAQYTVTRGKNQKRTSTYTLALKAANKLAA